MKSQLKNSSNIRIYLLLGVFFLLSSLITWRLFSVQIKQHDFYASLAVAQYKFSNSAIPYRGEIFSQDDYALAVNKKWPLVYAVPREIKNFDTTAKILSGLLEIDEQIIKKRLSKSDDPYEPLKQNISEELKNQIQKLNLQGIKIGYNWNRYYPGASLAAHLIGFVGQETGQYGLEKYYDKQLKAGQDLFLTLDYTVQFFAEKKLQELIEQYQAKAGSVIIMNPRTGALLAMASYPNFDPNYYSQAENIEHFVNPVVQHVFEPGSVFKPITMAAALDSGKVTPETTYHDSGVRLIGGYEIHNWDYKFYGEQTMTQVLEKSLNTGAIFAQEQTGKDVFLQYVRDFGFGLLTGIGLPGERKGDINNLLDKRDINYATASYGQGISVTPLQLITAISAIANNGKLIQPHIVSQEAHAIRQVISSDSAWQITNMLKNIVNIDGYEIASKTGTAQIPEAGAYAEDKTIHTLIGYAPADAPEFIILLKLDEPIGVRWSAVSLPPTFKAITEFLINYYQIAPQS